MRPVFVINGPNLNRLGKREPEIYGRTTLAEIERMVPGCRGRDTACFPAIQHRGRYRRMDSRGIDDGAGIIINPAAYSFTSIAILDALKMSPNIR
jgi:3-dehydroquinate dehydratase II